MEILLMVGGLVVGAAFGLYCLRLASTRADRLRRYDSAGADKLDQYRMHRANPAAIPMRMKGFDKPR